MLKREKRDDFLPGEEHVPEAVAAYQTQSHCTPRPGLCWQMAIAQSRHGQLPLPFALAGGGAFTAEKLNLHSRTNIEIIRYFLPVDFVMTEEGSFTTVEIRT
jgi:RNA 3'-terminal phosphate cyclase (ATP)